MPKKNPPPSPREAIAEALSWTRQDLKCFGEIAPDRAMLRARIRFLRRALTTRKEK